MRRLTTHVVMMLLGSFMTQAVAEVDLTDFDNDLMRTMEDSIKSFEPNIAAKNSERALADAQVLWDGFKWTEAFFAKQGNAADAVDISRKALEHTDAVMKFLAAGDFDSAAESARKAARTCRTCHDIYKET